MLCHYTIKYIKVKAIKDKHLALTNAAMYVETKKGEQEELTQV